MLCVFFSNSGYKILCQFLPLSQPHPVMNQKCTVPFFGHRSWCSHPLLLLLMIRLVMLRCTWSRALSLIWKCKLVTRASAPLLRAAPQQEHIWPVLHRPHQSLVRFQSTWSWCWFTRAIIILRVASLERSSFPLSPDTTVQSADQSYHQGGFPWSSLSGEFMPFCREGIWQGLSLSPLPRGERVVA